MCPNNMTSDNETQEVAQETAIGAEADLPFLFFVDVFSSSTFNRTYSIQVQVVINFTLMYVVSIIGHRAPCVCQFR